jgi:hypothetical protein
VAFGTNGQGKNIRKGCGMVNMVEILRSRYENGKMGLLKLF